MGRAALYILEGCCLHSKGSQPEQQVGQSRSSSEGDAILCLSGGFPVSLWQQGRFAADPELGVVAPGGSELVVVHVGAQTIA